MEKSKTTVHKFYNTRNISLRKVYILENYYHLLSANAIALGLIFFIRGNFGVLR